MDLLNKLKKIHRETLGRFTYVSDAVNYDMKEHWPSPRQLPNYPHRFKGDCDDFALMCRKELHKLGIRNRLVYCIPETGGGHLVCEVEGWILDNRYNDVMRRDDMPYTWVRISGFNKGDQWHTIGN
jgi:predicted transglutaminase-like cysteine proteinase